ncbi:expressed unknown protein [Seminavis robusta]|uniref:Uncharacterized protein n=1 Tax=Seminavis robusta TaxID=568900 RepID=A0A9N8DS37_9STRA|nr:expressed unknown protein [Seminavis robusta]|eukprot:Sro242_g096680.1 n/a (123) ;mRNA; r:60789-61157
MTIASCSSFHTVSSALLERRDQQQDESLPRVVSWPFMTGSTQEEEAARRSAQQPGESPRMHLSRVLDEALALLDEEDFFGADDDLFNDDQDEDSLADEEDEDAMIARAMESEKTRNQANQKQ